MVTIGRTVAALLAMQLFLAGCSTQQIDRFENKVGAMRCTKDRGFAEGSAEHQHCVAAYAAVAEKDRADTRAAMLGVAGAATQVSAAKQQGRANAALATQPVQRAQRAPTRFNAPQQHAFVSQQTDSNWNRTCRYADGTVIAVGQKQCPASIAGQY